MKVTVDDKVWRRIIANVKKAGTLELQVGITGSDGEQKHPNSDLTIGEIALIHEYGSEKADVPARPFLSRAFERTAFPMHAAMRRAASDCYMSPSSLMSSLRAMGQLAVGAVRMTIFDNIPPALEESTVRKKGHDLALVDSGTLMEAISYKIAFHSESTFGATTGGADY